MISQPDHHHGLLHLLVAPPLLHLLLVLPRVELLHLVPEPVHIDPVLRRVLPTCPPLHRPPSLSARRQGETG